MFKNYGMAWAILLIFFQIVCSESINNINNSTMKCPLHYWPCNNGECIRNEEVCDGIIHCTDRSDETVEQCLLTPCPRYAFRCAYGACITGSFKCNGFRDCVDGSDETRLLCNTDLNFAKEIQGNCSFQSEMQCNTKECININRVCDGVKDCPDATDETVALCSSLKCPEYSFRCGYGACITGSAKCNGIVDCMDGSDEISSICDIYNRRPSVIDTKTTITPTKLYPISTTHTTTTPKPNTGLHTTATPQINCSSNTRRYEYNYLNGSTSNCPLYYWQCNNGPCIKNEEVCDGATHCTDRSDETVEQCLLWPCPSYAFQCAYGACITGNFKCNGIEDCADGSDENKYLCNTDLNYTMETQGTCKFESNMQCKSGECISIDRICDGLRDCQDGTDETVELCSSLTCPKYSFRCGYGACIAGSAKCNGIVECADGSDEMPSICGIDCKHDINITQTTTTTTSVPSLDSRFSTTELGEPPITTYRPQLMNKYCSADYFKIGISTLASCAHGNTAVSCYHSLRPGTTAHVRCAPGYVEKKSKNYVHTLVCDKDGEWNYPKFRCAPDCGTLTVEQKNSLMKPWDVTIYKRSYSGLHYPICSGVIVSPKVVLTAGRCLTDHRDGYAMDHVFYNVIEGFYNYSYSHGDHINVGVHNVSKISIQNSPKTEDLAVLILVNYFRFSNYLKPICLPNIHGTKYLMPDNLFNIGRPIMRDGSKVHLEYLIARVDNEHPLRLTNFVNIYFYMPFINHEIRWYKYIL